MFKRFFLFVLSMHAAFNYQSKVVTYFTQLGCQGCQKTDPVVLEKWPQKFKDLLIIEYVINGDARAKKNKEYFIAKAKGLNTATALPMVFINDHYVIGAFDILEADDTVASMKKQDAFSYKAFPKFWARDRVLFAQKENKIIDSTEIAKILFSEDASSFSKNFKEIKPVVQKISGGEIAFKKAYDLGNGFILQTEKVARNIEGTITIPFIGMLKGNHSLPILTVLFGLADGFNPCAFFILTFLLAAMLLAASDLVSRYEKRKRILTVGFIFVFFSALIYFLFMGVWFNVFRLIQKESWLTIIAGLVALFAGIVNVKDYFFFQRGISCTLPKTEKLKFVDKVEKLKIARSWTGLIIGTIIIALTVNMYELLCTLGLPVVYLRILTLHNLLPVMYYLYLALYCLVYVFPLIIIILLFAYTLGGCEFSKENIKRLKLISGCMVLFLGLALLFRPDMLKSGLLSLGLVLAAVFASLIIMFIYEHFYLKR